MVQREYQTNRVEKGLSESELVWELAESELVWGLAERRQVLALLVQGVLGQILKWTSHPENESRGHSTQSHLLRFQLTKHFRMFVQFGFEHNENGCNVVSTTSIKTLLDQIIANGLW